MKINGHSRIPILMNEELFDSPTSRKGSAKQKLNIPPIDQIEVLTLTKKRKEIQRKMYEEKWKTKLTLSELYKLNEIKKKEKRMKPVTVGEMFNSGTCFKKYYHKDKMKIIEKCNQVIEKNIGFEAILKRSLEIQHIKELIFTKKQLILFQNHLRYINWNDHETSLNYLDGLLKERADLSVLDKPESDNMKVKMNEILYDYVDKRYGY